MNTLTPPVISTTGGLISSNALTLSGTADPGLRIVVYEGETLLGDTLVASDGRWEVVLANLAQGLHRLTVVAEDLDGWASSPAALAITVDTLAPAEPLVTSPQDVTNDATPLISGSAEASAEIRVWEGSTLLGATTADGKGSWSLTLPSGLSDGTHTLRITAADTAGHTGDALVHRITVDTRAPAAPVIRPLGANGIVVPGPLLVTGTAEAGSSLLVYDGSTLIGETVAEANGTWSVLIEPLEPGSHNLTAIATDTAGNTSRPSSGVTLLANTAPAVVSAIPDQRSLEDAPWRYTLPAGTFSDADGNSLTLSAALAGGAAWPAWLAFDAETRTFTGTPPKDFSGVLTLRVTASDGTLNVADTFRLTVRAVNDAPVAADDKVSLAEDAALSAPGNVLANDWDVDSARLVVTHAGRQAVQPGGITLAGRYGTLTIQTDGSYNYTADKANDLILGQSGTDTFTYVVSDRGLSDQGTLTFMVAGQDEVLTGNAEANLLTGGRGADVLNGSGGDDTLRGLAGVDRLIGGLGRDILDGGKDADADRFIFDAALNGTANVDTLVNFDRQDGDRIVLDNAVFTTLPLRSGIDERALSDAEFAIGTAATTRAHRIIYDTGTGSLFYDADGSRPGAMVKFAQVDKGLVLTHTDFVVI
jgi:VCBS repeat-containing protein